LFASFDIIIKSKHGNNIMAEISREDLEWCVWFTSMEQIEKRIDTQRRASDAEWARADAIEKAMNDKFTADPNQLKLEF
jgi:hypothetical protein